MMIHLGISFTIALIGLFAMAGCSATGRSEPLLLWPQGAPGEKGDIGPEHDTTTPGQDTGKKVIRLGNVTAPTITFYPAPAGKDTGATVVVCPGGGYAILAMDLEGTEVCDWLNSIGVNAVLLKYRVPARKGLQPFTAPLQDVQRALGLVRDHATEWKLDPHRIGVLGFSAGGHLAAAASTHFTDRTYPLLDAADQVSSRPDFAILIYPAYLVKGKGPELSPEITVTSKTPPTFLFQTENDPVHAECSIYYCLALKNAKVPVEMHILSGGGHGYGLRGNDPAPKTWPKLAEAWMRNQGLLGAAK